MDVLACGHAAVIGKARMCAHLLIEDPLRHVRLLTGVAIDYDQLCQKCADSQKPHSRLLDVCEGCVARAGESHCLGWRGEPEVRYHDRPVGGRWSSLDCPLRLLNERCVAAVPGGWLVLTANGLFATSDDEPRLVSTVPLATEQPNEWAGRVRGPALHTSADGRYAAAVTDYGRYGVVMDVSTGRAVLSLDRYEYHVETTPFPVNFVGEGAATMLVAATDWNRLDAFDLNTGQLVTHRDTDWRKGEDRPEHYLDYFHGRLSLSPSGRHALDDGWVWHPVGVPTLIDIGRWLDGDLYATEHGTTVAFRDYAWDQPVAWLDDETVAIQRIGDDDTTMIDGVQLFDVVTCRRTGAFAGPSGRMWAHGGLLYVNGPGRLEIWDPLTGARIGHIPDFQPIAQNRVTGELAELADGRLRIWRPED